MNYKDEPGALEREWLVLNCPHCNREVRIRSNARRSQLACPYCSRQLGKNKDPSHASQSEASSSSPVANSQRQRRVSGVKHPTWDTKQTEESALENDSNTTEYLEIDPNNENQMRLRRVRRKIYLNPWEKLSRIIYFAMLTIIGSGSIIVLISLVFKGREALITDIDVVDIYPEQVQKPIAAVTATDQIPLSITRPERDACLSIIRSFATAKNLEEKLALVTHPEITGPRMKESGLDSGNETYSEIVNSNKVKLDGGKCAILLSVQISNLKQHRYFAFIQGNEGIKMDWEVSFRYQPMPLEQFKSTRPNITQQFRSKLRNGDFYANNFDDKNRWYCVEIYYPGDPNFLIYGYIDRNTAFGQGLIARLLPSQDLIPGLGTPEKQLSVIASLRFADNPASDNQVEVVDIQSYSWFE